MSVVIGGLMLVMSSWFAYAGADDVINVDNMGRDDIMLTGIWCLF